MLEPRVIEALQKKKNLAASKNDLVFKIEIPGEKELIYANYK